MRLLLLGKVGNVGCGFFVGLGKVNMTAAFFDIIAEFF